MKLSNKKINTGAGTDFTGLLADRVSNMHASIIRETLKIAAQPKIMSLAGGLPAPESFPADIIEELCSNVMKKYSWQALQYGPSEGFPPLREVLVGLLAKRGVAASPEEVIITCGSQGALEALGKVLISSGDKVALESPTYLAAMTSFNPYLPEYIPIETDDDGVIPDALDDILNRHKVKFIYLIPTFQNPTGRTIPADRREKIAEIVVRHKALLVEDDAYSMLRYRGDNVPTIKSFAPDNVVYITTMSKVLAPGLRIGICVAPQLIRKWMVLAKQGIDLHSSSFDQALATEYIAGGYLDRQLPKIIGLYRPKLDAMLMALEKYFANGYHWSKPDGGMFVWVEGPDGLDSSEIYWKTIEAGVAFVPGKFFYTREGDGLSTMRLNFTNCSEKTIDRAVATLARVLGI